MQLNDIATQLGALGGFAAIVTLLIEVGKRAGVVKDGQAGSWSLALNIVGAAGLFYLQQTGGNVGQVDTALGQVAEIGFAVLALVAQIGASKVAYIVAKWAGVGKSLTA